jgi:hypothetical protein
MGDDRLEKLNKEWDRLRKQKATAWHRMTSALTGLEDAWQALQAVHGKQQALCTDLPALDQPQLRDWIGKTQLSLYYGPSRDPNVPHPMENDLGLTNDLRGLAHDGQRLVGTLAPAQRRN